MRCSCPNCGTFMEHAESSASCVCPDCLTRCTACLGAGSILTKEDVMLLKAGAKVSAGITDPAPDTVAGSTDS